MKKKTVHYFVISAFTALYVITSLISTVHVVDFFALTNPMWLAIGLAVAYEVGAAASLASIVALRKMNKTIVWTLFVVLTAMQAMGNTYFAYSHAKDYQQWIELFGLVDEEVIYQKRVLGLISGAILPMVALGFIKALVDYIKPEQEETPKPTEPEPFPKLKSSPKYESQSVSYGEVIEPETVIKQEDLPIAQEVTTTLPPVTEKPTEPLLLEKREEPIAPQVTESEPITVEAPEPASSPQLNNISETTRRTKTIDEMIARGEHIHGLKRPHDP